MVAARARFALIAVLAATIIAAPANAAKFYVSNQLGPIKAEERVAVATPQSVQLILDFQTDGVTNAKAIKEVKPMALKYVQGTGLFSSITDTPTANGALLVVRFNNIVDHGAAGKGFKAGLTFGLAGTAVTDNYDVTFELSPAAGQSTLKTSLKHALTTTIGKKSDPTYGTEYQKAKEAVDAMVGQAVEHGLFALAAQDGFPGK
jgi:hypothetical protein